ncbi:uncharacterized protein LOC132036958 isoform X2 [Lycium ferocissimum]|uniref:uncharacterized protein LOC132036958 isoform X2 n=1 Tax=Lycium ferocissimum TaxID=112874 RepID=UPI0028165376|nr:uncharacterized protein LOC132036958 isoform X2 [Lycium ferocissimum]
MGQIVKTKKKGRPSKADLAARRNNAAVELPETAQERELRRSGRRRNVRYAFDIDDYLDDDEYFIEDIDGDERRREKKLKLLLKLQSDEAGGGGGGAESTPRRQRPATSASSDDEERKPSKKRKINNNDDERDEEEEENDEEIENGNGNEIENENDDDEARGRNEESKGVDSAPGTPSEPHSGIPLRDKKTLELILDKLQKKDIYGVYAEPVDPEELPDYHEVIEHPMDFATVRNKLGNGSYTTLEQFESDIFLLCSNAMQYNSSDTIYHKQARNIQELATKKFEKLRINYDRSEKDVKVEQKTKYGSVVRKQIKKPIVQMFQETVGSDFSSGATLAAAGDNHFLNNTSLAGVSEKPYGVDGLAEGNSSLNDQNVEKAEESLSVKGPLSRFGRKSTVPDENRRASYNIATQPVSNTESIFSTFEDESKHLVTVGLYSDHGYARSLARFAATLGPVAWRVASQKIEQALPPGFKFGRGWVGEYEPLPTPVLVLENHTVKEPPFFSKSVHKFGAQKNEKTSEDTIAAKDKPLSRPMLEGKSPYLGSTSGKPTESGLNILIPSKEQSPREVNLEGRPSFLSSSGKKPPICASPRYQQPDLQSRNFTEPDKKMHFKTEPDKRNNFKTEPNKNLQKQVELNCPPSANQRNSEIIRKSHVTSTSEIPGSRSTGASPRNPFSAGSGSFKQPVMNGNAVGGLPNGRSVNNNSDTTSVAHLTADSVPTVRKAAGFFHREQEQGLSDPVQLMRMLAGKAQNQQNSLSQSQTDASPISPVTPSSRKDDSGNAAAAAARAWMSVGAAGGFRQGVETTSMQNSHISADSLYNSSRHVQQQASRVRSELPASAMHFQAEKNSTPLHAFVPHPARVGSEAQFQNQPMIFRQSVPADLSRFQVQSPWQSFNQPAQPRQKQDSLPPDLNISFQSSGSPGRPSSTVLVDSQQPDLALQL